MRKPNILLGLTGSVATTLATKIISQLQEIGNVSVIVTKQAEHFINGTELLKLIPNHNLDKWNEHPEVFYEENEWTWITHTSCSEMPLFTSKWKKDDPVLHIELRKWADVLVIAPLSANTLAKMANGLCDNLLTSVIRAWDFTKPIVVAPAMNVMMWEHPITMQHLFQFSQWSNGERCRNFHVAEPIEKGLACGDIGKGAMAEIKDVVQNTKDSLRWFFPIQTDHCSGIPINHPGGFGFCRQYSKHTGVDLYSNQNYKDPVYAMEGGTVVNIEMFTGPLDNTPWWNDTEAVLIEGFTGVICYGEIKAKEGLKIGQKVKRGDLIGHVMQVVKDGKERPDIVGHSKSMLHVELYKHGTKEAAKSWKLNSPQHDYMLDPTPFLIEAIDAPTNKLVQESYKFEK